LRRRRGGKLEATAAATCCPQVGVDTAVCGE
jgi:hypothetical protein